jgi:hypothetical protein
MKIEKSANHSHFFTQDREVFEMLTTGKTRLIRKLDFYYPNWKVLSEQAVIYLNADHVHHPEVIHEKPKETVQTTLF